jgi:magnesium transporter
VIIDAAVYVGGMRRATASSIDELTAHPRDGGFAWLGLRMPNEAELRAGQAAFGLPELAVDDALRKHDRPKVERDEGCLLVDGHAPMVFYHLHGRVLPCSRPSIVPAGSSCRS